MYKGGCLCGGIRFEITGKIGDIVHCHCSLCRKAQGGAFATNGNVERQCFHIVKGETLLTGYESAPGHTKYFCRRCGSPIFSENEAVSHYVRIRLGTIESDIAERPKAHIFVSSRASWEERIEGELPQYDSYPHDCSTL